MLRDWVGRVLCVGPALLLAGCGAEGTRGKYPIRVVATTGMVADLVRHVGGEYVQVTALMGEGVDPHLYKPSPGDISALSNADLVVYSGRHLEGKMAEVFARMAERKPTLGVADGIDDKLLLAGEGGHADPHVWFDVALWSRGLDPVRDALTKYDPAHAEDYKANAEKSRAKLLQLDEWARNELATIPKERRVLVTAHDAFRYFGRAYDVEVRGIQGISTESEAGVGAINELVALLKEKGIKAVFVESSVSPQNIKALVEGCASPPRPHRVAIGGELFSDAMGKEGTPEGTYEGMVRHNVRTIVEALK